MKIYHSTEYIKTPKIGDLKLEVNSIWDFKSRSVCYKSINKTLGVGETTIYYDLEKCVNVEDSFVVGSKPEKPCKMTRWEQAEITPSVCESLKELGYEINNI